MLNIKLRVNNLIRKHGTADPFQIAHGLNIRVKTIVLPPTVRGYFARVLRRKYIVLNSNIPELNQKVTLCHELGHARLHYCYGYYFSAHSTYYVPARRELEANEFAIHLLSHSSDVDTEALNRILRETHPDPRVVHQMLCGMVENG